MIKKKKWRQKSIPSVRGKASPKREQEEELERQPAVQQNSQEQEGKEIEIMNKAGIINSLSLNKLQDTHKYYSHQPGELIISWLLQCYGTGANSQELESKEAQQLGSLTRDWGINKRIEKGAKIKSLSRQVVLSVKEKHPLEKGLVSY